VPDLERIINYPTIDTLHLQISRQLGNIAKSVAATQEAQRTRTDEVAPLQRLMEVMNELGPSMKVALPTSLSSSMSTTNLSKLRKNVSSSQILM
jgi:hypothetical protein